MQHRIASIPGEESSANFGPLSSQRKISSANSSSSGPRIAASNQLERPDGKTCSRLVELELQIKAALQQASKRVRASHSLPCKCAFCNRK